MKFNKYSVILDTYEPKLRNTVNTCLDKLELLDIKAITYKHNITTVERLYQYLMNMFPGICVESISVDDLSRFIEIKYGIKNREDIQVIHYIGAFTKKMPLGVIK